MRGSLCVSVRSLETVDLPSCQSWLCPSGGVGVGFGKVTCQRRYLPLDRLLDISSSSRGRLAAYLACCVAVSMYVCLI